MYLERLSLFNFKNYVETDVRFSPGVNCLTGPNGSGKTNLLDAIYYLGFTKSFLNAGDGLHIREEEEFFQIQGWFEREGEPLEVTCSLRRSHRKQFFRNRKEYGRMADHIGLLPMVVSSPLDVELFYEGSEERRKFMNGVISQMDRAYLHEVMAYNRVLVQRNTLLRQAGRDGRPDPLTLEIYDQQLADLGKRIFSARKKFVEEFQPVFAAFYAEISDAGEAAGLEYQSALLQEDPGDLLKDSLGRDLAAGHTTTGIHRDDLVFRLGSAPLRRVGSQGQQKTFLVSLKLAQYDFLKKKGSVRPILLLDDIFDKLDASRTQKLVKMVTEDHFGQIFITDTHFNRMMEILDGIPGPHRFLRVDRGAVQEVPPG